MFAQGLTIDSTNVAAFESDPELVGRAIARLQAAGFEVLYATTRTISFSGSRETYERAFSTRLVSVERETVKSGGGQVGMSSCIDCPDTEMFGFVDTANSGFADVLEGVAIEEPYYLHALTAFPPPAKYWHLDVPGDVSLGCNADRAHRGGVTGSGIRIAMVDSGQAPHPFFTERGYRVEPTVLGPGTVNPTVDGIGPRDRRVGEHLRHRAGHHAVAREVRRRVRGAGEHDGRDGGRTGTEPDDHLVQLGQQRPGRAVERGEQRAQPPRSRRP